jgi:Ribbon-helix-helix protein, copG family
MERLSVRLTDRMFRQLDALADEHGVTRTRLVRQLLEVGLRNRPASSPDPPAEEELLELLAEKARQGNVAAIRSLLAREQMSDPRSRAIALFQEMVSERQP